MNAADLFSEARRQGLTLCRQRVHLSVGPNERLTPDFAATLKDNRDAILSLLCARSRRRIRSVPSQPRRRRRFQISRDFLFRGRGQQNNRKANRMNDTVTTMAVAELPPGDADMAANLLRGIIEMRLTHGAHWQPDLSSYPPNIAAWIRSKLAAPAPVVGDSTFPPARILDEARRAAAREFANEETRLAVGPTVKTRYA